MLVNALLLSSDPSLLAVLRRSAEELGIRPQEIASVGQAGAILTTKRFEGIVVDTDDLEGASGFIEALRKTPSNKSSIIVAVVNGRTSPCEAFRKGANMVLEKPVTTEKLVRSLRAAHSMMTRERRRAIRLPLDTQIQITPSSSAEQRATITDISEGGIGVDALAPLKVQDTVRFRCHLPDSDIELEGTALVVNATKDGHAGLCFVGVSSQHKSDLAHWLAARIEKQSVAAMRLGPYPAPTQARPAAGAS
jgi:ActR/RegA family two-component response regulator